MELKRSLSEIEKLTWVVKNDLRNAILSLPDNSDVSRINNNCFTVSFSVISKDKDKTMAPEYYDFKYQYKVIAGKIESMNIHSIVDNIKEFIRSGYVYMTTSGRASGTLTNNRVKLHPKVIDHLKEIVSL